MGNMDKKTDRRIRDIPDWLWRDAKIAAVTRGITLRELVIRALEREVRLWK